jgi:hypothetical protein
MSSPRPYPLVADEQLFGFVLELEIQKGLRLAYPVSVVTMVWSPLPDFRLEDALQAIRATTRAADLLSPLPRSAGLRLLLAGAELEDAEAMLERLREILPSGARVTFGVATWPRTARTAKELLDQADLAAGWPPTTEPTG